MNVLKKLLLAAFAAFSFINPALAFDPSTYQDQQTQTAPYQYQKPDENQLEEHRHYRNVDGRTIHSPAHTRNEQAPSGATAKCGDGTFSFSQHHRGTCSRHGGVVSWL
ncbi:hypothetical protein A4S02_10560 [Acetobacter ascendens]|uniref:DUF3761 domain-containing protein n=1 Tax=Acetobacter ascendens TaxID=481146 RepID=A0A1D8QXS4_9PROT|nr:DUF3761 domain-containing protein [Acetobacter ascendens]AOW47132.1 hypothetical protein A4S02_10560 [Acetobacter ascendens]